MRCFVAGMLALFLLLPSSAANADAPQQSPFSVQMPGGPNSGPAAQRSANPLTKFWNWIQATQQSLHRDLAKAVKKVKTEGALQAGFGLIFLSFIYGVVHAAGPGHGKAVISSYVLANEQTMRRGVILALLASLVQAITAITIVGLIAAILNMSGLLIKSWAHYLESASYALIALVGAWLLFSLLSKSFGKSQPAHTHDHAHSNEHEHNEAHTHHVHDHTCGSGCGHAHMPDPKLLEDSWSLQKAAAMIFAIGLRPCTGALIVLVFALAQGLFWAGIASTFAMSLGTAITVASLAVLAVGSKKIALSFAGGSALWVERVYLGVATTGALLVLLLGTMLFMASLGPARPF